MTAEQAVMTITPALALAYGAGFWHGFVWSASGVPSRSRLPAHPTVGALKSRLAEKPSDEYTAEMGGKTENGPGGAGA